MNLINTLTHGDCFNIFPFIPSESIDMICTDPPYNITDCEYECAINLNAMWNQFNRIIKPNGCICITSSQPFTTDLIYTNKKYFKYEWIWKKHKAGNFGNAKIQPLKYHEIICVFYKKQCIYNPQPNKRSEKGKIRFKDIGTSNKSKYGKNYGTECFGGLNKEYINDQSKYDSELKLPSSILEIPMVVSTSEEKVGHPSQKPIALYEYLIKTYTNPNMVVLDCFSGSGTNIFACLKTKRKYICIEKDEKYINMTLNRLRTYNHSIQFRIEMINNMKVYKPISYFENIGVIKHI